MVKNAALRRRLLKRDGYLCGVHVGGCGAPLTLATTTIDHIVPLNILRRDPEIYNQLARDESFLQPMCQDCNSARKQGRLDVAFTCKCHSATFFSLFGRPELLVSHTKGFVIRRLRISAEESLDGTYLFVWGRTKKGTVGYNPDQFGGVFEHPSSFPDGSSVIRTFRPINVEVQKELIASSPEVQLVLVEHLDLHQIASEASLIFTAIDDVLQRSIQAFVRQHSGAFLELSRAISLAGEQYTHLTSSVLSVPRRGSSKSGVQAALAATRDTNLVLPDASQRIAQQMSAVSREARRVFATPGMQQMLAGTREMNRVMVNTAGQCAKQMSAVSREVSRALATPGMQQMLAGIREMNRASSQSSLHLQRQYMFCKS